LGAHLRHARAGGAREDVWRAERRELGLDSEAVSDVWDCTAASTHKGGYIRFLGVALGRQCPRTFTTISHRATDDSSPEPGEWRDHWPEDFRTTAPLPFNG